jgi:acetolactate synthase-1/2/3 large subunit
LGRKKAANIIVDILEREDVRFIFGIPGGSTLPIYDALLSSEKVSHVLTRLEMGASYMADAYSRVTGNLGVCMATVGPGAVCLPPGVLAAQIDSIPLIAITGNLRSPLLQRNAQMKFDHAQYFTAITKWSVQVDTSAQVPEIFERAIQVARGPRPGAVHINFPSDVLLGEVDYDIHRLQKSSAGPRPSVAKIEKAVKLLSNSSRPIIWAGGGVILADAQSQTQELAEVLAAPVATSYNGRGSIPEDHPLSIGRTGQFTPAWKSKVIQQADVVLTVGFRFTDVSTWNWSLPSSDSKVIQVDIDPSEIGKNCRVEIGIIADARDALSEMIRILKAAKPFNSEYRQEWARQVQQEKEEWARKISSKANSDASPLKPQRIMKELREVLPRDAIVTAEAGFCKEWPSSMLPIYQPRTWIHPAGLTPMGYSVAGAIGAKLAKPNSRVVAITGDGAFQMISPEMMTAVENDLPILVCILNDRSHGMIRFDQVRDYGGRITETEFHKIPDFVKLAESYGARGQKIDRATEIREALVEGLRSDVPFVLDFVVDRNEVPGFA